MKALVDNTRSKPFVAFNVVGGAVIYLRPSLVKKVTKKGKSSVVEYGNSVLFLAEEAAKVEQVVKLSKDFEKRILKS